jgi:hypothetical protein
MSSSIGLVGGLIMIYLQVFGPIIDLLPTLIVAVIVVGFLSILSDKLRGGQRRDSGGRFAPSRAAQFFEFLRIVILLLVAIVLAQLLGAF